MLIKILKIVINIAQNGQKINQVCTTRQQTKNRITKIKTLLNMENQEMFKQTIYFYPDTETDTSDNVKHSFFQ